MFYTARLFMELIGVILLGLIRHFDSMSSTVECEALHSLYMPHLTMINDRSIAQSLLKCHIPLITNVNSLKTVSYLRICIIKVKYPLMREFNIAN